MFKKFVFFIAILLFYKVPSVFGVQLNSLQIQKQESSQVWDGLNSVEEYKEGYIRRSEVLFLLSIPFIFFSSILATGVHYSIATLNSPFSISKEALIFAGLSSLALVSGLIYVDLTSTPTKHISFNSGSDLRVTYEHLSKISIRMLF